MLDAPAVPIEMKVFQGGGDTSLLQQPQEPIQLKVYQGGVTETRAQRAKREAEETAKALAKAPNSTPTISPEADSELDAALGTPGPKGTPEEAQEAEVEAPKAPEEAQEGPEEVSVPEEAPKAPEEVQEAPKATEEAPKAPEEASVPEEASIPQEAEEAKVPKESKTHDLYDDVETVKLSNGIRVRSIPEDPEKEMMLKGDIQALHFTNEEEILFRDVLKFDHPFIRGFITSPEMKEDFYTFWKTYITYDGSDTFLLLTYNEGRIIQKFMKTVLRAYREYLMNTSLAYLMKQEESDYEKEKESELGYELFNIQYGEPKVARSSEELEAEKKQIAIDSAIQEKEDKEEEHAEEIVDIRRVERAEKAEGLPGTEQGLTQEISNTSVGEEEPELPKPKNQDLRDMITKIFSDASIQPERKIMKVIQELDSHIPNKALYQQKIMNAPLITMSSLIKNKIPISDIIKYDFVKNPSITDFLRTLLKVDLSSTKFKKEDRTQFVIFFSKVVTNEAAARLSSYVAPTAEKRTRKVNFRGGGEGAEGEARVSTASSSRFRVRTSRKVRSK